MGRVIDQVQAVDVGNLLEPVRAAGMAVHMDRQDARGFRGDGGFHLFRVQVAEPGLDVHEHGPDVVPPQGVRGGHKAEGRGDDLARDPHHLQGNDQGQGAVGAQGHIGHIQVPGQLRFQLLVKGPGVGEPFAVPDLLHEGGDFGQGGEERLGDGDGFFGFEHGFLYRWWGQA